MNLAIDSLRARFHSSQPLPAKRRDEWLGAFAEADGDALSEGLLSHDEWLFIAQLPVAMRWSLDADATAVGETWQRQLRAAIEQALVSGDDGQVIRYRSRTEALADLLYRSALGDRSRQWVWQRMGLLARADGSAADALTAGVASLIREPQQIWPVLHRLLFAERETAALSALLRALPVAGWRRLLAASPRTAAYIAAEAMAITDAAAATADTVASEAVAVLQRRLQAVPEARALLHWVATRGHFAAQHLETLTVLLAALAGSAASTSAAALRDRLLAVRAELAVVGASKVSGARAVLGSAAQPASGTTSADRQSERVPVAPEAAIAEPDALPALPVPSTDWHGTEWGGSLFWLGRFAAAGALEWLAARPELPADALPLLLRAIADALGLPGDDPAREAFCGGQLPPGDVPPALDDYAATLLAGWSAWLDEAAPELAVPRLQSVCRRRGRIRFEPGWIELLLPLDAVDTSIRRLGLDLDPGWLPWLACVMRIRYE